MKSRVSIFRRLTLVRHFVILNKFFIILKLNRQLNENKCFPNDMVSYINRPLGKHYLRYDSIVHKRKKLRSTTVVAERARRTFLHRIDADGIHYAKALANFCA